MTLRALLALFIAAGSASAQDLIGGSSGGATGGGGGAPTDATYWLGSANGSLSAEIVVNDIASLEAAISAYDFNDAANLTTGDLAAARMSTNWGTAGTSACATADGVMIDDGSAVGCRNLTLDSSNRLRNGGGSGYFEPNGNGWYDLEVANVVYISLGAGGRLGLGLYPTYDLHWPATGTKDTRIRRVSAGLLAIEGSGDGTYGALQAGGLTVQDPTATTGDTLFKVLSGAGESGNCQEWDDDGTGALASVDCETGNSVFSNVTLGTTGATFYGPSASEPIDCTTSNDGSMYFDTDDQKLCICANDGTDDEWLHSDNYGHGSGHCSI